MHRIASRITPWVPLGSQDLESRLGVRGGRIARLFAVVVCLVFAGGLAAAEALFPQPLHITRRLDDPISHSVTTVHEYCAGNQVVTIAGARITIADHARQELTEIDRVAGTYSVTSFADLAAAEAAVSPKRVAPMAAQADATPERWKIAGNSDAFAITFERSTRTPAKMDVRFDRNTRLSKAAFEVLIGAAFPHQRSDVHDALVEVSRAREGGDRKIISNSLSSDPVYALPVDQTMTFEVAGDVLTVHSTVLDVRSELVPPGTLTIPPGSRLVESHTVRLARELREADGLPSSLSH
jgi:hypothetical protein